MLMLMMGQRREPDADDACYDADDDDDALAMMLTAHSLPNVLTYNAAISASV